MDPFDVSGLSAITGGGAASQFAILSSLRNNSGPLRASAASSDTASDTLTAGAAGSQTASSNITGSNSTSVRTLAELDKFADREEQNRARIQERFQSIAASMTNLQRHGSFLSNLAARPSSGLIALSD